LNDQIDQIVVLSHFMKCGIFMLKGGKAMIKANTKRERLSIDVSQGMHRKIKAQAALEGISIRAYVVKSIQERISQEGEIKDLKEMTKKVNQSLKKVWDNKEDSIYDEL